MAPRMAQPWRWSPTMRPKTLVRAAPSAKIEIIWTKLHSAVGFSNGWAALTLKKPPPFVPSILIATWLATGPSAIVCFAPSSVVDIDVSAERLGNAAPDQVEGERDADGQQHVERATREVDPERTDGLGRSACETPDERHRERDAGRGRQEVLMRQPQHLRQVGQRALAAVVLPVRVGDEAVRRVEGEIRRHGALAGGIERQGALEPQDGVEDEEAADVEVDHRDEVGQPALLVRFVDAAEPVETPFDRTEQWREEGSFSREDARHVKPQWLHQRKHDCAVERNLDPAVDGHGDVFQKRSGRTSA